MLTNQFIQLADAFQDHLDQLESSRITIQSLDPAHCSFSSPVDGCDVVVSWSENEGLELDVMPEFSVTHRSDILSCGNELETTWCASPRSHRHR